ncbi:hypothetical protein VTG60DRAFT_6818 [Thermothelomyces hinnuleus]
MRLAPPTSQVSREVSFEYLNRQLVWHAFTEFLLFVLPLVGINRWRRWLARTWRRTRKIMTAGDGAGDKKGEYSFLPERTCAICYQDQNSASSETELLAAASSGVVGSAQTDITNPYEAIPCGCTYCFVCLATRIEREEGEGWPCLRCGELIKECKPWNGDVLEEPQVKSSPATTKTVVFADDVKAPSDNEEENEGEEQQEELGENEGESSQVLVEADPDRSLDDLRPETPSVASDQADDSQGSESEDYEAEEDGLDEDPES